MPDHRDPLAILHTTRDPEEAAWAMTELSRAGFRDRYGFVNFETSNGFVQAFPTREEAQRDAVRRFRQFMLRQWDLTPLVGRDLACWCPLDQPCHADVLLEVANR
jgi:hypothetical protein